jgi:CBS domain-containing protein
MARSVTDVMNREVFSLRAEEDADAALADLTAMGITGAPVVDAEGRPLGVLSLRDLAGPRTGDTAGALMTRPAAVVRETDTLAHAGHLLAQTGYHRLVVVDDDGRTVGVLSALDVVRGLLGIPAVHPRSFPHLDRELGLVFSDDQPLVADGLDDAPAGPGLILLVHGGAGVPERVVWAEAAHDVHARLTDMVNTPQSDRPILDYWLSRGPLRFRTAAAAESELPRALERLARRVRSEGRPTARGI